MRCSGKKLEEGFDVLNCMIYLALLSIWTLFEYDVFLLH